MSLKCFLSDSESLLIKKSMSFFFLSVTCLRLIQTVYGKIIPIYQTVYLQRKREDMRKKQNKTAEALIVM